MKRTLVPASLLVAGRHEQFIAEQQKNWKRVRVFDSQVEVIR
jgi:hypothetical protein